MDKRSIEFFKAHQARRARLAAHAEAIIRATLGCLHAEQAPKLTPNELDRFMQRRIERDSAQHVRALALRAAKKKLPLPTTGVFARENSEQVRPRVVAHAHYDESFDGMDQDAP